MMCPCIKFVSRGRFRIFILFEPTTSCFFVKDDYTQDVFYWGRTGFDGDVETKVAGRGAAGLVKSGNKSNCQQRLRIRLRCLVSRAPDRFGGHVDPDNA